MMMKFLIVILLTATNQFVTATNGNVVYNPKSAIPRTHEESERKEVCMGELGCFDTGYPFDSPGTERILNLAPDPREEIGTEFRFFSPKNKDIPQYVTNMNFSSWDVKDSGFFRGWITYFILHGFMGGNKEWPLTIKNALLNKESCNVIIVDWTNGHGPLYEQAVSNIRVVGAEVGLFIQRMMNVSNLYPEFVHIIGHSLGAHASGYAGKWFRDKGNKLVSRITGLDPAGPYFNGVDPAVRLDKGDADFVDVIHTNAAWTRFTGFGLEEPIGDVDFYPNGGEDQTGCSKAFEASAGIVGEVLSYFNIYSLIYKYVQRGSLDPNVDEHVDALACSHDRAHQYFLASIDTDCKFLSLECYSWEAYEEDKCGSCETQKCVRMGYYAAKDLLLMSKNEASRKFYLKTKDKPPYCLEKSEIISDNK